MADAVRGRFDETPSDALAAAANRSELAAAAALWEGLAHADMAHLAVLHSAGLVDTAAAQTLLDAIVALAGPVDLDPHRGDVYVNRFAALGERTDGASEVLHTGRARREATTVAWHLAVRRRLLDLGAAGAALGRALVDTADEHRDTVMPDFTYLHHAQPTTLAHYLLGFSQALERALHHVAATLADVDRSPAGIGSINGSRLGLDRALAADLLEFDGLLTNTRDAMWAADAAVAAVGAAFGVAMTIDRLAEDLQVWTTAEFGYLTLADEHSRQSVIMPQKRNPYALTHLRGHARELVGVWAGVAASMLTPSGQPDNRVLAHRAVPHALDTATGAAGLAAEVIRGARFDTDAMGRGAAEGFTAATDVADLLVAAGVDNRTAHAVVGAAVTIAMEGGDAALDASHLAAAATGAGVDLPPIEIPGDAADMVASRTTTGGAGPDAVAAMIAEQRSAFEDHHRFFAGHRLRGFEDRIADRTSDALR
jgi:argininosuccinate lyase